MASHISGTAGPIRVLYKPVCSDFDRLRYPKCAVQSLRQTVSYGRMARVGRLDLEFSDGWGLGEMALTSSDGADSPAFNFPPWLDDYSWRLELDG